MTIPVALRLSPKEREFCELFAAEHGLAAFLDHLDLTGWGNYVIALQAVALAATKLVNEGGSSELLKEPLARLSHAEALA